MKDYLNVRKEIEDVFLKYKEKTVAVPDENQELQKPEGSEMRQQEEKGMGHFYFFIGNFDFFKDKKNLCLSNVC